MPTCLFAGSYGLHWFLDKTLPNFAFHTWVANKPYLLLPLNFASFASFESF